MSSSLSWHLFLRKYFTAGERQWHSVAYLGPVKSSSNRVRIYRKKKSFVFFFWQTSFRSLPDAWSGHQRDVLLPICPGVSIGQLFLFHRPKEAPTWHLDQVPYPVAPQLWNGFTLRCCDEGWWGKRRQANLFILDELFKKNTVFDCFSTHYTLCNVLRGQPYLLYHDSSVSVACHSIIGGLYCFYFRFSSAPRIFRPKVESPSGVQRHAAASMTGVPVKCRIQLACKRHFRHPLELTRKRYLTPRLCENESDLSCRLWRRHPSFKWDRRLGEGQTQTAKEKQREKEGRTGGDGHIGRGDVAEHKKWWWEVEEELGIQQEGFTHGRGEKQLTGIEKRKCEG